MKLIKAIMFTLSIVLFSTVLSAETLVVPDRGGYLDDNVLGSFLVYPKFDIRGESTSELRLTNYGYDDVLVKLNFVCPGVKILSPFCAALDTEIPFTPHQTRVIDVSDLHPPCNQGFVVAFALNERRGHPISYNHLGGSYNIFEGRRHESDNAIAFQSVRAHDERFSSDGKLRFGGDGADYRALGTSLYTDFTAVSFDPDQGSRLTLLTLDTLAGMQNPAALVFIDFWNSAEVPYSTSHEFLCWSEVQLDAIDLNFREENLGTTHGSMKITPFPNCPIPGGCPPMTEYDPTILGAIQEYGDGTREGHTLYHDGYAKYTAFQPR